MGLYLWPDIQKTMDDLQHETEVELEKAGKERVNAELKFKRIRALAELELKQDGLPWSAIKDIAFSREDVQKAFQELGYAEVTEKACQEKINELKHRLTTLREQFSREWSVSRSDYEY